LAQHKSQYVSSTADVIQGSQPISIAANLSFRPKQTDAFSSTFAPAKVSVCGVEKSLFVLSRSPTAKHLQFTPSRAAMGR
jgi:hypothetical protein